MGYKYNFYPDKPILHHRIRALIATVVTLVIPIAAVSAVVLLAVGRTIGAPTYITYRLVKHIRSKRQEHRRRHRMDTISRQWMTNDNLSTYINADNEHNTEADDLQRAVQASLITYGE